jgi:phosphohistidine phosphatase
MKRLFLLRHAKAENAVAGSTDLDRSLNERGEHEAQAIGAVIKRQNLSFDQVLCSTAVRARETAELVLAAAEVVANIRYDQRIYEAGPRQLLEVISELSENLNAVLLVGHNPGMEELLKMLTGRAEQMATCTLAKIFLAPGEWSEISDDKGTLDSILRPKDLANDC